MYLCLSQDLREQRLLAVFHDGDELLRPINALETLVFFIIFRLHVHLCVQFASTKPNSILHVISQHVYSVQIFNLN